MIRRHELMLRLGREPRLGPSDHARARTRLGSLADHDPDPRPRADGLIGVLRYQPFDTGQTKMLAVPGTRLGLIPHPGTESSPDIDLVEGPPDMIAARSSGLARLPFPAITRGAA